jgi:hypothetical protein
MTVIVQLPFKQCKRIRRYDPVGHLLPGWNFFAPKPVGADFAVWYRSWDSYDNDQDEVLEVGALLWMEVAGIEQRRIIDAVVNPGRYTRKSIFTCCNRIVMMLRSKNYQSDPSTGLPSDAVMLSLPYLLLVTKVSSLCRQAVAVQFRIDVIRHERETVHAHTVFQSAVHRVLSSESGSDASGHVAAS